MILHSLSVFGFLLIEPVMQRLICVKIRATSMSIDSSNRHYYPQPLPAAIGVVDNNIWSTIVVRLKISK